MSVSYHIKRCCDSLWFLTCGKSWFMQAAFNQPGPKIFWHAVFTLIAVKHEELSFPLLTIDPAICFFLVCFCGILDFCSFEIPPLAKSEIDLPWPPSGRSGRLMSDLWRCLSEVMPDLRASAAAAGARCRIRASYGKLSACFLCLSLLTWLLYRNDCVFFFLSTCLKDVSATSKFSYLVISPSAGY